MDFADKYTEEERDQISHFMTQIGWVYWADRDMAKWEGMILRMYGVIMEAGERNLSSAPILADDDDYGDHPLAIAGG